MSTQTADILKTLGSGHQSPDVAEIIRAQESTRTVKFAWHPWKDFPNFCTDGFKFNIQHPVLERMKLIPIPVFPKPVFKPRTNGFAVGGFAAGQYFPAQGVGSTVETVHQMPAESMGMLLQRYREFGMTDITALTAQAEEDKAFSYLLYHSVMSVPFEDEDERAKDSLPLTGDTLLMEDLPKYLTQRAEAQLEKAIRDGVQVGESVIKVPASLRDKGLQMIGELLTGIQTAEQTAIGDGIGILPTTARQINAAKARMKDNKSAADKLDLWLMFQYPSFNMDTDAERAGMVAERAVRAGAEARGTGDDRLLALLEAQDKKIDMLAQIVTKGATAKK